jgi:hypothetical protein
MAMRPAVNAPDWSESHYRGAAKCRGAIFDLDGKDIFFEDSELALGVCNGDWDNVVCPRRTECLRVAMFNAEAYGVWGGMLPADRLRMRLRHPGAPERWTWHAPGAGRAEAAPQASTDESEEEPWPLAA